MRPTQQFDATIKAGLIVCERRGHWAAALAPLVPDGTRPVQTRSLGECHLALAELPASLVAVELTVSNGPALLAQICRWRCEFPRAQILVLSAPSLEAWSDCLREAGALQVIRAVRELPKLAGSIRAHLDRFQAHRQTLLESIWPTLPWHEPAVSVDCPTENPAA